MAKTEYLEGAPWEIIFSMIRRILNDIETQMTICLNIIKYVYKEDRERILAVNHACATARHRGITKTTKRLQQQYYWENMKDNVIEFIHRG